MCAVQVMPSGEVADVVPPAETAQKTVPFHATHVYGRNEGVVTGRLVRIVQVIPSGEVSRSLLPEMRQNRLPFQPQHVHEPPSGSVRAVHVMPSGEVAPLAVPDDAMKKTVPFQAMQDQDPEPGSVRDVQVMPSGEVMTLPVGSFAMAQKREPFQAMEVHANALGSAVLAHTAASPSDDTPPAEEPALRTAKVPAMAGI